MKLDDNHYHVKCAWCGNDNKICGKPGMHTAELLLIRCKSCGKVSEINEHSSETVVVDWRYS